MAREKNARTNSWARLVIAALTTDWSEVNRRKEREKSRFGCFLFVFVFHLLYYVMMRFLAWNQPQQQQQEQQQNPPIQRWLWAQALKHKSILWIFSLLRSHTVDYVYHK